MPKLDRTNDEFMDEFCRLILKTGISIHTVGELATRLRCSRRRLYEIAPSKEGLLLFVAARHFARTARQASEAAAQESVTEKRIDTYLKVGAVASDLIGQGFVDDMSAIPEGRELTAAYTRTRVDGIALLVEEGIAAGTLHDIHARLVAEVAYGAVYRMRDASFLAENGLSFRQALEEFSRLLRHGLVKRDAAPAGRKKPSSRARTIRSAMA